MLDTFADAKPTASIAIKAKIIINKQIIMPMYQSSVNESLSIMITALHASKVKKRKCHLVMLRCHVGRYLAPY